MSDALIIYCGFMYLFTAGIIWQGLHDPVNINTYSISGMACHFIFAPVMTPFLLGAFIYDRFD